MRVAVCALMLSGLLVLLPQGYSAPGIQPSPVALAQDTQDEPVSVLKDDPDTLNKRDLMLDESDQDLTRFKRSPFFFTLFRIALPIIKTIVRVTRRTRRLRARLRSTRRRLSRYRNSRRRSSRRRSSRRRSSKRRGKRGESSPAGDDIDPSLDVKELLGDKVSELDSKVKRALADLNEELLNDEESDKDKRALGDINEDASDDDEPDVDKKETRALADDDELDDDEPGVDKKETRALADDDEIPDAPYRMKREAKNIFGNPKFLSDLKEINNAGLLGRDDVNILLDQERKLAKGKKG